MILLSILWITYFVAHSLLASDVVKQWVEKRLPPFYRYYRIGYNTVALTAYIGLFAFQKNLTDTAIAPLQGSIVWVGIVFVVAGTLIILIAFKNYSLREFTGLPSDKPQEKENSLKLTGLNSLVRHPIYFGTLIALLGYLLYSFTFNTLIFVIIAIVYLFIGSVFEERNLVRIYGKSYLEYQKNVPRIIPWFIK